MITDKSHKELTQAVLDKMPENFKRPEDAKPEPTVSFSPEQEAELTRRLEERLNQERLVHQREVENIRSESQRRLAAATGSANVDQFLAQEARRAAAEAHDKQYLEGIFGPHSSGKRAQELYRQDPVLYHQLRSRYQEVSRGRKN